MAKKIIRLTESDLAKIVKRVLREEETSLDYKQLQKDLFEELKRVPSYQVYVPNSQPIQFEFSNVTTPTEFPDIMTNRTITIEGDTGTYFNDKINFGQSKKKVTVTYKCQTSNETINKQITSPSTVDWYFGDGRRGRGTIFADTANILENTWCKKLDPVSGRGLR